MRSLTMCLMIVSCFCGVCFSEYDLTLTGINRFDESVSYSGKSIVVLTEGLVIYSGGLVLDNCVLDISGSVELGSNVSLVDSVINVDGNLKVMPGTVITEGGLSSIIASGNLESPGRVVLEGNLHSPIIVNSDYVENDVEFIIIDPNSSTDSNLKFIDFYGGWCNVWVRDKRLNESITNCRFFGADYAIWQDGVDELTDVKFSFFYDNGKVSIFAGIDPSSGGEARMLIDNVVIDNNSGQNSLGCWISGSSNSSRYGIFEMTNSIIVNSYCGWYLDTSTYVVPSFSNVAYHGNSFDDNLVDSSALQNGAMFLVDSPFEVPLEPSDWSYFIDPNSPVANVELGYSLWQTSPSQLVTSLFRDSSPRGNVGIGFGVPILQGYSSKVYSLDGDFNEDGVVNFPDFAKFAIDWMTVRGDAVCPVNFPDPNGYSICDFNRDEIVDANDLQVFAGVWLSEGDIRLTVVDDENLLTIICQDFHESDADYAIFLDEEYVASRNSLDNPVLVISKAKYSNGLHDLRAVIRDDKGSSYVTASCSVPFNSSLSELVFEEIFDPSVYYSISGKVVGGYTATITIKDSDDLVLWSEDFTSDFAALVDPNLFSDDVCFDVSYSCVHTLLLSLSQYPAFADVLSLLDSLPSESFSIIALGGKSTNKTAGLLICMIEDGMKKGANFDDTGTVRFAEKQMKRKGITTITLLGYGKNNQVNRATLNKVFKKYENIRYQHIYAHGNWQCDGAGLFGIDVQRTRLRFNDGDWPAFNSRAWTDYGLTVPDNYVYLSKKLEAANCLMMFPYDYGQVIVTVVESCSALRNIAVMDSAGAITYIDGAYEYEDDHNLNAHPSYFYSDISMAFKMWSDKQVVLGSAGVVIKGSAYPYWLKLFNTFWESLANNKSGADSLNDATSATSVEVMKKFRYRGIGLEKAYLKVNP